MSNILFFVNFNNKSFRRAALKKYSENLSKTFRKVARMNKIVAYDKTIEIKKRRELKDQAQLNRCALEMKMTHY